MHSFTDEEISEHDRQVAERAWDEGRASSGIMYPSNPPQFPTNPYRVAKGEQ